MIIPHRCGGKCRLRAATPHPPFSFPRKKTGGVTVQKKGVRLAVSGLNKPFASGMGMPARGKAAFSIAIRLASASIIRCCAAVGGSAALRMRHTPCGCRSTHLVEVRSNLRLPRHYSMRRVPAMPHSASSLPPNYRHSRLTIVRRGCKTVTIRRDSWRSHVHRTYIAQRVQLFELQSGNVGGRGEHPSPFSGGSKGGILFGKRIPPLPRVPTAVGQNTAPFGHPKREYSFCCMNKKRSTNKRKLRITYHEQNENRYDHCLRTA